MAFAALLIKVKQRRRGADDAGTAPEAETPHRCFTSWRVARICCREGCRDRAAAAAAGDSEGRKANLFDHSTACATVELDIIACTEAEGSAWRRL